jgi:hypothetical protein
MSHKFLQPETYYNDEEKALDRVEPAWAKAALCFRTGSRFAHQPGSIRGLSLLEINKQLKARKKRFRAGDTMELLHAIRCCAEENLPLPTWVALEFNSRFEQFLQPDDPTSLDDIFFSKNLPVSKKHAIKARRNWRIGSELWWNVWEAVENYSSLDDALEAILKGGNYGVGKTTARKLVLMIDKNQRELLGKPDIDLMKYFKRKKSY